MKHCRIEYRRQFTPGPLTFWVHRHNDHALWACAKTFDPPLPKAVPGKGYAVLIIDAFGCELEFSSIAEVEHFLDVLGRKNLPTATRLSRRRGPHCGPNRHWLSRLPARLKPWKKRTRLLPRLAKALGDYRAVFR